VGANQGKHDHLNKLQDGLLSLKGSTNEKKKTEYQKRWLSWNLQPRTAESASQAKPEPKAGGNSLNSLLREKKNLFGHAPAKLESTASHRSRVQAGANKNL